MAPESYRPDSAPAVSPTAGGLRIGWVGTGRMGYELVLRLLDADCDVAVWNRTRSKAEPLAEHGATIVDTPADLADRDIVVTIVSYSDVFEKVTLGESGVLSRTDVRPPVLVDSSTISVESSERVRSEAAELGTAVLAAPVSGNPSVVKWAAPSSSPRSASTSPSSGDRADWPSWVRFVGDIGLIIGRPLAGSAHGARGMAREGTGSERCVATSCLG